MKKSFTVLLILGLMAIGSTNLSADESMLHLSADYNIPIGNSDITPNVGFGVGTTFWGIFELSANIYTEIIYGAENIFNISGFRPVGLFSWGMGVRIPMGGISLIVDWQNFYTGLGYSVVDKYSDSYKYGISVDISKSFSIELYSRTLFNFSQTAIDSDLIDIESEDDKIQVIGVGAVLHLF